MNDATPTRPTEKIAVLLRDDLEGWQRLNATAFLVSGIGARFPEVIGEPYRDADDVEYLPMFGQPVMVFSADKETLRIAHSRAVARELAVAVFTADLFSTGNDTDNRAAVAAVRTADLDLVGIAVFGPRNAVDRAIKGARKHALYPITVDESWSREASGPAPGRSRAPGSRPDPASTPRVESW